MNEYINGSIVGLSQVIIGHPLDTIKTNLQYGGKKVPILSLFRGIKYPMTSSIISNIVFFGNYDYFYKHTNSTWISGAATGFIGAFVLNPFEARKVRSQSLVKNINKKVNTLFLGLQYTIFRETLSNSIYFSVYHLCKNKYEIHPFLSGGIAGLNSWFWSYPLDIIKTRKQLNPNLKIKDILKLGSLSNGLTITLIRGFLVNGFSFYVYDILKNCSFNILIL